jgi:predicted membrane-bound spermidine synthase
LRLYAWLELGIAASCAVSPWLIDLVRWIYGSLGGQMSLGPTGATIVRLLGTVVVLGLPTVLMGGTLPAAAKAVTDAKDTRRRGLGLVYGCNTLGAVAGTALCTFYLLPLMGTRRTLWLTCILNMALAALSLKLASAFEGELTRHERRRQQRQEEMEAAEATLDRPHEPAPAWLVYLSALTVGCVFLMMELVWYRLLTPLLGGTTYTFGLILAIALAGIGLGGGLFSLLYRWWKPAAWQFALCCALEALVLAIPFAMGDELAIVSARGLAKSNADFAATLHGWINITLPIVFPAALLSGLQFPLLISLLGHGEERVGKQVGAAFAFNTLGCILGSLLGGFGLMPLLTAPGVWRLSVVAMAILGMLWLMRGETASRFRYLRFNAALPALAALGLILLPGPGIIWRHTAIGAGRSNFAELSGNKLEYRLRQLRRSVQWEHEGVESSLAIRGPDSIALYVNGKSDGNAIGDASTQILLGMVPATIHPAPKAAFVVGLGTGETAGWLGAIPEMERVDCVELEPAVVEMARRCAPVNHDVLHNPKVRLIFNDARESLTTTRDRYDLIISEPSNPFRAGVANLFTREFYAAASHRLNERGIFAQWLQSYEVDPKTLGIALNTLSSQFRHVELWQLKQWDLLLLASNEPLEYDVVKLRLKLRREPFRSAYRIAWRTDSVEGLLSGYVGGQKLIDVIAANADGELNTDDHNRLEYAFARAVVEAGDIKIDEWRNLAIDLKANRPAVQGAVEWERVIDHYLLTYLADEEPLPFVKNLSRAQSARWVAWNANLRGDHALALDRWNAQSYPPETSTELAAIAVTMISQGDPRAPALIERLRDFEPIEADTLSALLTLRNGDKKLAAMYCERALLGLRKDPWPVYVGSLCRLAQMIGERDERYREKMYDALREPFAMQVHDPERISAATALAEKIGGKTLLAHVESFEPYAPWTQRFLAVRAKAYDDANHPLARAAERDLKRYEAQQE